MQIYRMLLTAYISQITLANASILNEGFRRRILRYSSSVFRDTERLGLSGTLPMYPCETSASATDILAGRLM